jgi:hypothetical protein
MEATSSTFILLTESASKIEIDDLVDQMFLVLNKVRDDNSLDASKVSCIKYTVSAILHNGNYHIILSDPSRILIEVLRNQIPELIRDQQQTKGIISHIIEILPHLLTYNGNPTMENFIKILRSLKVGDTVIKRYEFIYSLSNSLLLPTLKLGYSQDEVL